MDTRASWPEIHSKVRLDSDSLAPHQQLLVVSTASGVQRTIFDSTGGLLDVVGFLETSEPAPWCITLSARSLVDSTESDPVQACAGNGKAVPPPEKAPVPRVCAAPTEDVSDGGGTSDISIDGGTADTGLDTVQDDMGHGVVLDSAPGQDEFSHETANPVDSGSSGCTATGSDADRYGDVIPLWAVLVLLGRKRSTGVAHSMPT